jgi:plasmid stabilization system protein ParE
MLVRWSPRAAEDVSRIVAHIRQDNPDAAQRTAEAQFTHGRRNSPLFQIAAGKAA